MIFSLEFSKNDLIKHLWWLVSKTRMLWLIGHILLLNLRLNHFNSSTKKFLDPTPPFLDLKNSDVFTQIQQNDPIRHLWWLVSETRMHRLPEDILESKTKSFQQLKKKFFRSHSPFFRFQKQWHFHSNSVKTSLSDTCDGWFHRHVCTEFQEICFYWTQDKIIWEVKQKNV